MVKDSGLRGQGYIWLKVKGEWLFLFHMLTAKQNARRTKGPMPLVVSHLFYFHLDDMSHHFIS